MGLWVENRPRIRNEEAPFRCYHTAAWIDSRPSRFAANGAWLVLNVIAHNLARWVARIIPRPRLHVTSRETRTEVTHLAYSWHHTRAPIY